MQLRDYQIQAVNQVLTDWQTHTDILGVAATGAGKTQILLAVTTDALDATPNSRGLVVSHRVELVDQPMERIRQFRPDWLTSGTLDRPRIGALQAARADEDRQLTFATVQSLTPKRLARLLAHGPITHLVVDESHHATADTYLTLLEALKAANPNLRHLGVTATPQRGDGDGLAKVYQAVSFRITIQDLVQRGFLVQPRWLAIQTGLSVRGVQTSRGDFVQNQLAKIYDTETGRAIILGAYQQYANNRQAIAFTASVAGAYDLAASFRGAGIRAETIEANTPADERKRLLSAYRAGEIQILTNVDTLTEGFDAPGTSCILMCRPTRSDGRYLQCLDTKTEILTDAGWVSYDTAWMAQQVAAFDPHTGLIAWMPIKERFNRPLAPGEQMYSISSPTVDLRVTGGHRMLMRHRRSPDPTWRFVTAEELSQKRSEYVIPVAGHQIPAGVALTSAELRFLGIWLSDGTINKHQRQVTICQAEHQPQNADIAATLAACGINYRICKVDRVSQFNITSPALHYTLHRGRNNDLARFDPYFDKNLSPLFEQATSEQLAALLEGIHIGDGIKERNVSWTRRTYHICTGNLLFAERLQSLCVRRGFRCNVATHSHNREKPYYVLHVKYEQKRYIGGANQFDREHLEVSPALPDERVWCLGNEWQTLIVRRNGKVAIVGNCMGRGLRPAMGTAQPGEDCLILDFLPEETRNITLAGDVLGLPKEVTRTALTEQPVEPGEVQAGFTFDGFDFNSNGTPLEIISRELNYLDQSPFIWHRQNGALSLGCGEGPDKIERVLYIERGTLYALWRRVDTFGQRLAWNVRAIDCDDAYATGQEWAAKHSNPVLAAKGRAWHRAPASEPQIKFLANLTNRQPAQVRHMTRGEIAQAITHAQAAREVARYRRMQVRREVTA